MAKRLLLVACSLVLAACQNAALAQVDHPVTVAAPHKTDVLGADSVDEIGDGFAARRRASVTSRLLHAHGSRRF